MNKQQRREELKKLARSVVGDALEEELMERIGKLRDGRNYDAQNFEMDGKASVKAAVILESVLRDLKLLKTPPKQKKQNQYI
jgi:hypothetical protein